MIVEVTVTSWAGGARPGCPTRNSFVRVGLGGSGGSSTTVLNLNLKKNLVEVFWPGAGTVPLAVTVRVTVDGGGQSVFTGMPPEP